MSTADIINQFISSSDIIIDFPDSNKHLVCGVSMTVTDLCCSEEQLPGPIWIANPEAWRRLSARQGCRRQYASRLPLYPQQQRVISKYPDGIWSWSKAVRPPEASQQLMVSCERCDVCRRTRDGEDTSTSSFCFRSSAFGQSHVVLILQDDDEVTLSAADLKISQKTVTNI